jgi:putative ABC transport system permease protein
VSSAAPAVRAIARHELRRRWRALVLLGLAAGLVVGTVAATAAVTVRTATALDRLRTTTAAEDARVQVFTPDPTVAEEVATRPAVEASWAPTPMVGRVPGSFNYVAILSGPEPPPELFRPVVLEGRRADPRAADEVMVGEAYAEAFGIGVGDVITLDLLTAEEFRQFDVGFGDPDGAHVELTVTGIIRLPPGSLDQNPVIAGSAFNERHGPESGVGRSVFVRLADGRAGLPAFRAEVADLASAVPVVEGGEEIAVVQVSDPAEAASSVEGARRVLVTALAVFGVVATLAGLLALAQAFARHHAGSAPAQRVEAALGLTGRERAAARTMPALVSAGSAALVAVVVTLAAGAIEPLGPLRSLEPTPGWRPDPTAAVAAALCAVTVVVLLASVTARRAGRRAVTTPPAATSSVRSRGVALARRPAVMAGLWFALLPGRAGRAVPVRTAVVSAVAGVAGLVAALTFTSSLDRLEATPTRWGWPGEVVVVDATPAISAELADDPRTAAVTLMSSSTAIDLEDQPFAAWSLDPVEGELAWTVTDGRLPAADDEVALGPRVAEQLDVRVGDTVTGAGPSGAGRALRVVGSVIMPRLSPTQLGSDVVVTPAVLAELGTTAAFSEAMVRVQPGVDVVAYRDELAERFEIGVREPPPEVANLAELGALPSLLGAFLALLGALALAHALVVVVRRRAVDLAVLRAMGFTPRQAGAAVVGTGLVTALVGTVVGVPTGLALARLAWWVAASDAGVASDLSVPWAVVALVVPSALVLAAVVALLPARRATRVRPGPLLRAE